MESGGVHQILADSGGVCGGVYSPRIFVYEDDMWTVKGRYDHALEDDDDVSWTYENGHDVLRFLLVSFSWYVMS